MVQFPGFSWPKANLLVFLAEYSNNIEAMYYDFNKPDLLRIKFEKYWEQFKVSL